MYSVYHKASDIYVLKCAGQTSLGALGRKLEPVTCNIGRQVSIYPILNRHYLTQIIQWSSHLGMCKLVSYTEEWRDKHLVPTKQSLIQYKGKITLQTVLD